MPYFLTSLNKLKLSAMKKVLIIFGLLFVLTVTLFFVFPFYWRISHRSSIFQNIYLEEIPIGGLSIKEAHTKITKIKAKKTFKLYFKHQHWEFAASKLGIKPDLQATVKKAYRYSRSPGIASNIDLIGLFLSKQNLHASYSIDDDKLKGLLSNLSKIINRPALDAQIKAVPSKVRIEPEQTGYVLNKERSIKIIKLALKRGEWSSRLVVEKIPVKITSQQLKSLKITAHLSRFSTSFNPIDKNRLNNIILASEAIDNTIIQPNKVFSFNQVVGPRQTERGYKTATVIRNVNLSKGVGGGICQVATTLYNAALEAGLPIIERKVHSTFIKAYPLGRDATVTEKRADLKIGNNTDGAILIKSQVINNKIIFDIYGYPDKRKNFFSKPVVTKYVPFRIIEKTNPDLPSGVKIVAQQGVAGRTVTLERYVKRGKKLLFQEKITSRYLPRPEIIEIGP
jgi:vancomycin resistance protein YoaR